MYACLAAGLLFFLSVMAHAAEIHGRVESVIGGEPLARVQVVILENGAQAITAKDGSFLIPGVVPGNYTLRLNAVGYRLVTVPFSLTAEEASKEFSITLVPDNFRRTDTVEVKGDVFHGPDSPAVNEINLTSSEVRQTSTVLADDPFRAVQTLPGVAASGNNDFYAQFSVQGTPFEDVSTYLDGILVPQAFHGLGNVGEGASLSVLTSETIEDIKLLPAAYPEKYGDSVGAALDMQTRDGSRTPSIFRASIGLADTELLGEGELGKSRKGSWLASARKSYLGYLLRNRLHETFTDVSFYDGDLKLTYDIRPNQAVSFYGVGGHTDADLVHPPNALGTNDFKSGTNDFVMARAGWRWAASPHLLLDTRAAFLDAPFTTDNLLNQSLQNDHHDEWVAGSNVVWSWRKNDVLEGGWTARRVRERNDFASYNPNGVLLGRSSQEASGWRQDGYVQQASSFLNNRLHILAGLRLDTGSGFDIHPVSPQVSASMQVARLTQFQFGFGRYNQFEFPVFDFPLNFPPGCTPAFAFLQTANHYSAAVERRIGESTRIRASFFDRENGSSEAISHADQCMLPFKNQGFSSLGRDYSRGLQFVLQSRTANRLSGWIGYTLTYARQSNITLQNSVRALTPYFPTLQDQRHTLNLFASYRLTPTIHLSEKFLYGFGFPIPSEFDSLRLGTYARVDVRGEKDWAFHRWKLALYGEVLNLTNHNNPRYIVTQVSVGNTTVITEQGLPITPTAGVAFEF